MIETLGKLIRKSNILLLIHLTFIFLAHIILLSAPLLGLMVAGISIAEANEARGESRCDRLTGIATLHLLFTVAVHFTYIELVFG